MSKSQHKYPKLGQIVPKIAKHLTPSPENSQNQSPKKKSGKIQAARQEDNSSATGSTFWLKLVIISIIGFFLIIFNYSYRSPLLLGFIIAALTYPIYNSFCSNLYNIFKRKLESIAAISTLGFVSVIVLFAGNIMLNQLLSEIQLGQIDVFFENIIKGLPENEFLVNLIDPKQLNRIQSQISGQLEQLAVQIEDPNWPIIMDSWLGSGAGSNAISSAFVDVSQGVVKTFGAFFDFLVHLIVFLLTWFFGLTQGPNWIRNLFATLPLETKEKQEILEDLNSGIRNVIYANLLSGIIHTMVVAITMTVFGLPNIVITSIITFLIGVLPLSPSEIGYVIPVILLWQISPVIGIIAIIAFELIILWVNYILTPKVISAGDEGNPLLILTSILSGIAIFGLMGFIIAPVIMIFVQTLYRILVRRIIVEDADAELI